MHKSKKFKTPYFNDIPISPSFFHSNPFNGNQLDFKDEGAVWGKGKPPSWNKLNRSKNLYPSSCSASIRIMDLNS